MKGKSTAYQYDFDGVLADNAHRSHLAPADFTSTVAADWDRWSDACMDDAPIIGSIRRMELDWFQAQVHIVSSRSTSSFERSRTWLHTYVGTKWDYLKLRAAGDRRKGWELKVENILELRESGIEVVLAYEDIKSEAEQIYERTGVPVVLINPAYDWVEKLKADA